MAEATLAGGTLAVLKLLVPQDGAVGRHEITMLRLSGGGAVLACCVYRCRSGKTVGHGVSATFGS